MSTVTDPQTPPVSNVLDQPIHSTETGSWKQASPEEIPSACPSSQRQLLPRWAGLRAAAGAGCGAAALSLGNLGRSGRALWGGTERAHVSYFSTWGRTPGETIYTHERKNQFSPIIRGYINHTPGQPHGQEQGPTQNEFHVF